MCVCSQTVSMQYSKDSVYANTRRIMHFSRIKSIIDSLAIYTHCLQNHLTIQKSLKSHHREIKHKLTDCDCLRLSSTDVLRLCSLYRLFSRFIWRHDWSERAELKDIRESTWAYCVLWSTLLTSMISFTTRVSRISWARCWSMSQANSKLWQSMN